MAEPQCPPRIIVPSSLRGWNEANSQFNQLPVPSDAALDTFVSVQPYVERFPGGTVANYTRTTGSGYNFVVDPDVPLDAGSFVQQQASIDAGRTVNFLPEIVATRVRMKAKLAEQGKALRVLWVANPRPAYRQHAITAVQAFVDAGITLAGIELGNEGYLTKYAPWYPNTLPVTVPQRYDSALQYLADVEPLADMLKERFPNIPLGLVLAPDPILREVDSGSATAIRLNDWNNYIYDSTIGDTLIWHLYCTPADSVEFVTSLLPQAMVNLKARTNRNLWITEWNLKDEGVVTGSQMAAHYVRMMDYFKTERRITIATCHNLVATNENFNAIARSGDANVNPTYALNTLGIAARDYQ